MRNTFNTTYFKFLPGEHNSNPVIWIHFPYNNVVKQHLLKFVKAQWSSTLKSWYCVDNDAYRTLFKLPLRPIGQNAIMRIESMNREEYVRYRESLILSGFSESTIRTYTTEFAQLLYILKNNSVATLTPDKLRSYFLYCHQKLKLSTNQIHSRINAVKYYFEQVLHRPAMFIDIPRPKKPLQLPKALTKSEIEKIIKSIDNIKHRLIIKLCYGMGLRVSEVVKIKIEDIDSTTMQVRIENAKGKKDRYVKLPQSVLDELRMYYRLYKPQAYLFQGQWGGQYNVRSAQVIFKQAMNKSGIKKTVGIHSLRHSYATHLLQYGTDIAFIQKLLGHNDIKTTLRYLKITNNELRHIESPLDRM